MTSEVGGWTATGLVSGRISRSLSFSRNVLCVFNKGILMIPTSDPGKSSLLVDVFLSRRPSGAVMIGKVPRGWQGSPRAGAPMACCHRQSVVAGQSHQWGLPLPPGTPAEGPALWDTFLSGASIP